MLKALGNPEKHLKYVHIAGTNGKGSTSIIIGKILAMAGYKVGGFTSPHIYSYVERFTIGDKPISAWELKRYMDEVEQMIKQEFTADRPTEFEVLSAIAFKWFKDNGVDIAILEVGMGGIFDSTNVITPQVSVITSIALDHVNFLGNTVAEVAYNKAGIIKDDVPLVIGEIPDEAWQVVEEAIFRHNAPIFKSNYIEILKIKQKGLLGFILDLKMGNTILEDLFFALPGDFQLENLAIALTTVSLLQKEGYRVDEADIREGLGTLRMPGRLEVVSTDPLVIVDVAHNALGAEAISRSLDELLPNRNKILLCGIVDDKDAYSILGHLGENTVSCTITRPEGRRGNNWQRLQAAWQNLFPYKPVIAIEDINDAVDYSLKQLEQGDYLLICGSFYVVAKARRVFTTS